VQQQTVRSEKRLWGSRHHEPLAGSADRLAAVGTLVTVCIVVAMAGGESQGRGRFRARQAV
jgi:hypothetical protein